MAGRRLPADLAGKVGASDVVQETFYAAQRKRASLRGRTPGELVGWLERILARQVVAARRRFRQTAKRRVAREVRLGTPGGSATGMHPAELAAPTTASPLSRVVQAERAEALRAALAGLSPLDAQVIRWHGEDQLPFGAIGERLGTSAEAARKRWARALAQLEARLEPTDAPR